MAKGYMAFNLFACALGMWAGAAISAPILPAYERVKKEGISEIAGGAILLAELQCVKCHAIPETWDDRILQKGELSLQHVGDRLSEASIELFLENPNHLKPGTLMPQVTGIHDEERQAVAKFLASLKSKSAPAEVTKLGDAELGEELFHTVGCVACHAPDKSYPPKELTSGATLPDLQTVSVPLALAKHYSFEGLVGFLKDPLAIRHGGRMPKFELSDEEARSIAKYLQPDGSLFKDAPSSSEKELALGREVFQKYSCVACHDLGQDSKLAKTSDLPILKLRVDQGCLADSAGPYQFHLDERQKKDLQDEILKIQRDPKVSQLLPLEKVEQHLTAMNCYACHEKGDRGGIEDGRKPYFTVHKPAAHSLGEIGMLPPKLDHIGRKLTVHWMEKLLWGEGGGVRPYMTARMPKFGRDNVHALIPAWVEASKKEPETEIDTTGLLRHQRSEYGRQLLGTSEGGLGCISCHGLKGRDSLGVPVIDLTHTVERLRPEYFKDLLLDPQKLQSGTLMPPLFTGRKKADLEVEQIWTYLKEVDQFRMPDGLVKKGDYQLKPEQVGHPMVFRTFLEGAGTQAIAVGYPNGMNVAFDAYEVRWTLAWKGPFLDAMSTWEERQMTPAKPLGLNLTWLTESLPFTLSESHGAFPVKFGQEHGYRFKGYRLDAQGVPTMLYRVGEFTIEDCIKPSEAGDLIRTLRVSGPVGEPLWYRRGDAPDMKPVLVRHGSVLEEHLEF